MDKLTFNVENFQQQVGAMLITKSLSNDFKYDKAVQMESSGCGTFTTNTIPAQGEEFGFYLYNLNNFTEYDAFPTSDVKVPIPKNARPATFGPHSLHARTVLKGPVIPRTTAFSTVKRFL